MRSVAARWGALESPISWLKATISALWMTRGVKVTQGDTETELERLPLSPLQTSTFCVSQQFDSSRFACPPPSLEIPILPPPKSVPSSQDVNCSFETLA